MLLSTAVVVTIVQRSLDNRAGQGLLAQTRAIEPHRRGESKCLVGVG